jgi:hypothetical protein
MNKDLINFIELCLLDGEISQKEREVIFRKSKEYGIPEDECEIILDGMIIKHSKRKIKPDKSNINETEIPNEFIDDKKNKDVVKEIEINSILKTDETLIKNCYKLLEELKLLINPILSNPESINQKFIDWMKDLKNKIELKEDKFNKKNILVHKDKYFYGQTSCGEIYSFIPSSLQIEKKNILGQCSDGKNHYIITDESFIQYYIERKEGWFKVSEKLFTYPEQSFDSIDYFNNKEHKSIFRYFLREFINQGNVLSIDDLIGNNTFEYDETIINKLLLKIPDTPELSIVYKVNLEIKKIVSNLMEYLKSLDKPIEQDGFLLRNVFSPYDFPIGFQKNLSINDSFFKKVDLLELRIKFLIGVITLRNDFILSIVNNDSKRIKFLKIKLDELGLLLNFYESNSLKKLDNIITVVSNGFNEIKEIIGDVIEKLNKLDDINNSINQLNESVEFGNLLNIIQTYQVYKINKNTKSLLDS